MIIDNSQQDQSEPATAIDLRDVCGYIPLPHFCIQECGSAARVMGALWTLKDRKSRSLFHRQELIAERAGVSVRSVSKHLHALSKRWIDWGQRTGWRRTCTITVTEFATNYNRPFSPLPLWFRGSWAESITYAAILGKAYARERALADADFEHIADDEPFTIRLSMIEDISCLDRRTIKRALTRLQRRKLLDRTHYLGDQYPAETTLLHPPELGLDGVTNLPSNGEIGGGNSAVNGVAILPSGG